MSEAFRKIRFAHQNHVHREGKAYAAVPVTKASGHMEQLAHGTTQAALAAWFECRLEWKRCKVVAVGGVNDYSLHYYGKSMEDVQTDYQQALYVECADGRRVYLTGCSWGYGGEGPHGTALILADIGLYKGIREALRYVSQLPQNDAWRMEL